MKNGVLTYKNWIESWVHFNQSIEKGKTKGKNPGNLDILDIHDVFIPINYFPEASFKTICHLIDEQNFNPEFMIKLMIRNLHKINDDKTAFLFNYIDQHINSIKKGTLCEIFLDLYFNHHIEIANSFIKKYEKALKKGKYQGMHVIDWAVKKDDSDLARMLLASGIDRPKPFSKTEWKNLIEAQNRKLVEMSEGSSFQEEEEEKLSQPFASLEKSRLSSGGLYNDTHKIILATAFSTRNAVGKIKKGQGIPYSVVKTFNGNLFSIFNTGSGIKTDQKIGEGRSGTAKLAIDHKNNELCVVKIVNGEENDDAINDAENEIKALEQLDRLKGFLKITKANNDVKYYIFMNYFEGINLDQFDSTLTKSGYGLCQAHQVEICLNYLRAYQSILLKNNMIHEDLCEVNLIINPKNRMIEIIDFVTAAKINLSNFRSVFNDLSDMITYCKSRFRFLELFRKLDNMHTALDEIESNWPELSPEMSHHNLTLNQIKALVDDTIRELNQLLIELNRFPKVETIYDLEEDDNINRKRLRPFELSDPEQALMADDYESQVFIPSLDQFSLRKRQKRDEVKLDKLMTDYIQELDNEGKNQAKPATIS